MRKKKLRRLSNGPWVLKGNIQISGPHENDKDSIWGANFPEVNLPRGPNFFHLV